MNYWNSIFIICRFCSGCVVFDLLLNALKQMNFSNIKMSGYNPPPNQLFGIEMENI